MTFDEAQQSYDGSIPDELRRTFMHGSLEAYYRAFLMSAEHNFKQRFKDILRSICIWRLYAAYPEQIKMTMLQSLSQALYQSREPMIESWFRLQERSSASAVIALPIKTA